MPIPAAAIIPAAAGLFGGLANSYMSSRTARRNTLATIQANRELAEYSFAKSREMWELQNEYNSPMAQMQRLKAAGLNPALVYGQGAVGNQSGPAPSYDAPNVSYQMQAMQIPELLGLYQDFQLKKAQIDNVRANTENVVSRTANEGVQNMLLKLQGKAGEFDLQRRQALAPHQLSITQSEARQAWERWNNLLKEGRALDIRIGDEPSGVMGILGHERERAAADALFAKYRAQWMKLGIHGGDNMFIRILTRMASESGFSLEDLIPDK